MLCYIFNNDVALLFVTINNGIGKNEWHCKLKYFGDQVIFVFSLDINLTDNWTP